MSPTPTSPYRTPAERPEPAGDGPPALDDCELVPALGLLWLASLARVAFGIASGEVFGGELTVAVLAVLLLPLLAKDGVAALLERLR